MTKPERLFRRVVSDENLRPKGEGAGRSAEWATADGNTEFVAFARPDHPFSQGDRIGWHGPNGPR